MSDENDQLKQLLPFDDVREILGRICIHCGAIANVLRLDGKENSM
jgi:hypothetical protein